MATGRIVRTLDGFGCLIERLAFSPDGRHLAIARDEQGVVVYDCHAGRWLHDQPLNGSSADTCWDLAFSPDGRRLATGSQDNTARLWDLTAKDPAVAPVILASGFFGPGHKGTIHAIVGRNSHTGRTHSARNDCRAIASWRSASRPRRAPTRS